MNASLRLPHIMTEDDIIKLIRAGGRPMEAGVKALYQSVAQSMLRFFVYKGVSADEAKDILQETIVRIVRGADAYSGGGAGKAWIWQIARNCLVDHQRKNFSVGNHEVALNDEQWRQVEQTAADPRSGARASVQTVDQCVDVGLKLFSEKEPERAHALLLQMDGFSIEEIGLQIGRTTAATKEYLSQCRKRIQPFLVRCVDLLAA